jgi:hypothetical protein
MRRTGARAVRDRLILRLAGGAEARRGGGGAHTAFLLAREDVVLAKDVKVVVHEADLVEVVKNNHVLAFVMRDR